MITTWKSVAVPFLTSMCKAQSIIGTQELLTLTTGALGSYSSQLPCLSYLIYLFLRLLCEALQDMNCLFRQYWLSWMNQCCVPFLLPHLMFLNVMIMHFLPDLPVNNSIVYDIFPLSSILANTIKRKWFQMSRQNQIPSDQNMAIILQPLDSQ